MSRQDWQELIRRYCPADRRVCNCGDAYYTLFPDGAYRLQPDGSIITEPHWACDAGCGANQIFSRDYVAKCIMDQERKA